MANRKQEGESMKEKELREAIEGLEKIKKGYLQKGLSGDDDDYHYEDYISALSNTIQTLKTLKEASGELGRRIEQGDILSGVDICSKEYDKVVEYSNQMHDKASIVVKGYKLENEELKDTILIMKGQLDYNRKRKEELKQKLQEVYKRLEEIISKTNKR